jgi:hypothetical protein
MLMDDRDPVSSNTARSMLVDSLLTVVLEPMRNTIGSGLVCDKSGLGNGSGQSG